MKYEYKKKHKPIFSRTGLQLRYTYFLMVCVHPCYHAYTHTPVCHEVYVLKS